MSKLEEKAEKYFKSATSRSKVYATSDGFMFAQMQYAKAHARTLKDKTVLTLRKPSQSDAKSNSGEQGQSDFLKMSVPNMEKALDDITDIPTLQAYLDVEANSENPRATAIAAIENRIEDLAKDIEVK